MMFLPRRSSSSGRRTTAINTRQFERKLFSTTTVAWIQWCIAISLSAIKTSFLVLRVRNNQTYHIVETFVPIKKVTSNSVSQNQFLSTWVGIKPGSHSQKYPGSLLIHFPLGHISSDPSFSHSSSSTHWCKSFITVPSGQVQLKEPIVLLHSPFLHKPMD